MRPVVTRPAVSFAVPHSQYSQEIGCPSGSQGHAAENYHGIAHGCQASSEEFGLNALEQILGAAGKVHPQGRHAPIESHAVEDTRCVRESQDSGRRAVPWKPGVPCSPIG